MGIFDPSSLPSSPTSQSTATSGVSPWAQPYVSNYLDRAQQLAANQQTPALLGSAYTDMANYKLPGGFASGAALAEQGGKGSLSTAPLALDYGQQGAQFGARGVQYGDIGAAMGTAASRAGDMYAQQATSPEAMQAYMSPYMQNVVDYQKQQAVRDYQIQAPQMAAQAVGSGAFGGNRLALQQSEANRGLQNRLAGIEATGQQQAYQNAQQAQQFGSSLGLQGLQTGMQGQQVGLQGLGTAMQGSQVGLQGVSGAQQGYAGATQAGGTLGNIAAQESQARLAALALKNQMGQQQQQFPYYQTQFLQGMLSGLPVSQQTTQGYQSGPNPLSQIAGLGTSVLGSYLLYDRLKGSGSKTGPDIASLNYSPGPSSFTNDAGGVETAGSLGFAEGGLTGMLDYGNEMRPMGQIAPSGYGLAELLQSGDIPMEQMPQSGGPMGAGMGPAFGGSNEDYINSLYQNMLGRQADQGGYQHNLNLLNSGQINQQDLAGAFRNSAEAMGNNPRAMGLGEQISGYGYASGGLVTLAINNALKG